MNPTATGTREHRVGPASTGITLRGVPVVSSAALPKGPHGEVFENVVSPRCAQYLTCRRDGFRRAACSVRLLSLPRSSYPFFPIQTIFSEKHLLFGALSPNSRIRIALIRSCTLPMIFSILCDRCRRILLEVSSLQTLPVVRRRHSVILLITVHARICICYGVFIRLRTAKNDPERMTP